MQERPVGVSGLMRIKNEEEYVEASIDSVVEALDELIICYQECSDNTPAILECKQKQYPDKIKLYFYAPKVYSHHLTPEEYAYACSLPDDSPHLLSSYYNYTLSKATYRYAVKIDADQIYFTERMKLICDAYRSEKWEENSFMEKLASKYTRNYLDGNSWKSIITNSLILFTLNFFGSFEHHYQSFILKKIANSKCMVAMGGINLYKRGEELLVCGNKENDLRVYNGFVDHYFFEITIDTYYYAAKDFDFVYNRQKPGGYLIEKFHYRKNSVKCVVPFFCWYHLRYCKKNNQLSPDFRGMSIRIRELRKLSYTKLLRMEALGAIRAGLAQHLFVHDHDRSYPLPEKLGIQ